MALKNILDLEVSPYKKKTNETTQLNQPTLTMPTNAYNMTPDYYNGAQASARSNVSSATPTTPTPRTTSVSGGGSVNPLTPGTLNQSGSKPVTSTKSATTDLDTVAKEVIAGGKWGNGAERRNKLAQAGYDYSAVQQRVNQLLSGGSGGTASSTTNTSTVSTTNNYKNDLLEYFKQQNEEARKSAIDAIDKNLQAQESAYNAQSDELKEQYQALKNQSEVERYKSRNALREALANRGQLDSGYGRQEALNTDVAYGNAINSMNMQELKTVQEIKNLIEQAKAEASASKAQTNNAYTSAIQQLIAQLMMDSK